MHRFELFTGDCRTAMLFMEDSSIDSVVCDPPYGLSDHKPADVAACLSAWLAGEEYRTNKRGFMGSTWDSWVPGPEVWREVFRVLKPGGHIVAFAGSRTHDLMSMALRLAGFECRDTVMWVYGSGFPKSMDVSKAIDKARDDSAEILRVTTFMAYAAERSGVSRADVDAFMGTSDMGGWWLSRLQHRCQCPNWDQWLRLKELLDLSDEMDSEVWRLNGRKGQPGEAWQTAEVLDVKEGVMSGWSMDGTTKFVDREVKAANSDAARQWAGWGTALKPAFEPALLFRKPLVGTVAANVLAHGTGGLNIDGCRVPAPDGVPLFGNGRREAVTAFGNGLGCDGRTGVVSQQGRFPANLIHDGSPEVVDLFPDSNGAGPSLPRVKITGYGGGVVGSGASEYLGGERIPFNSGSGSAARFFYCPKASRKDRGATNGHPTVKPTDLMAYLCRLVTPPGGLVFDPFMGSGSTGKAAIREGFRFIGCDLSPEYVAIAEARISHEAAIR